MKTIMAMPGARIKVANLCMFGLAACQREHTDGIAQQVENADAKTKEQARVDMVKWRYSSCTSDKMEQTGTWVHQACGKAMVERDDRQKATRGLNPENCAKTKAHVTWRTKWSNSFVTISKNCYSLREGWDSDENKGGWLDP